MYFVKSDISQFEHLTVLLLFTGIVMFISGNEAMIIKAQQHIDKYFGFYAQDKSQYESQDKLCNNNMSQIKYIITIVKEWLIKDYKSSQCRKWIKWINNKYKGMIIFSS
jgi:hypothetical protein